MNRNRFRSVAAAATLALAATATAAAADSLTVGFAAEPYPPFFQIDASGQWTGWEIDIAKAICAKMQAECTLQPVSWDSLIPELTAKKIDLIVASMTITDERKKSIEFSVPYYDTPAVLVGPKDAPDGVDLAALKGKAIGVQQSTIHQPYAEKHFTDSDVKVYQTQDEANQDLASGRLDYVQADILAMNAFVASETGAACCKLVGEVPADPAVLGAGVGVGMRQGEPDLKKRVDDAIRAIMADGTFDALTKPVFGDMNIKPAAQ